MRTAQDILENMEELINDQKKEIASLKEQLNGANSLVKDSFEIIRMTCSQRGNIDNRIKVQEWLKLARARIDK